VPVAFTTRSSLLNRIKTGDEAAWQEFVDFYRPLIAWAARRKGLGGPDVDDIVQEVLADLFKDRERFTYDRSIGRFRDFLHLVTVRRILKFLRKRPHVGLDEKTEPEAKDTVDAEWESEYQRHLLVEAMRIVRQEFEPKTYHAFEWYELHRRPAGEVARDLGISTSAVYTYRNRIVSRLREIVRELDEA